MRVSVKGAGDYSLGCEILLMGNNVTFKVFLFSFRSTACSLKKTWKSLTSKKIKRRKNKNHL